jgi:hypothetical protein
MERRKVDAAQQAAGADPLIESPVLADPGFVSCPSLLVPSSHQWAAQLEAVRLPVALENDIQ